MTKFLLCLCLVMQITTVAVLARGIATFSQAASCAKHPALLWRST